MNALKIAVFLSFVAACGTGSSGNNIASTGTNNSVTPGEANTPTPTPTETPIVPSKWTAEQHMIVKKGCISGFTGKAADLSITFKDLACMCFISAISKKYDFEFYGQNEYDVTKEFEANGTIKKCIDENSKYK
jgi:hypothetical protein